jgi:hypothetical protein
VALIDYDDAKGILDVVLRKKTGKSLIVVQPERLIGCDMNSSVLGCVATFFCVHDTSVVAEGGFEPVIGLLAELIAVTKEQSGLGQVTRLGKSPQQICSNDRFAGSCG